MDGDRAEAPPFALPLLPPARRPSKSLLHPLAFRSPLASPGRRSHDFLTGLTSLALRKSCSKCSLLPARFPAFGIGALASRQQKKGERELEDADRIANTCDAMPGIIANVSGDLDQRVRLTAFRFLDELQRRPDGDLLSRTDLLRGFAFEGQQVSLVSAQQGIFKPKILNDVPLSILTTAVQEGEARPYEDAIGSDGLLEYRYRGTDIGHRDNIGLRLAMQRQKPLIYFLGIVPGRYVAAYPVFVVADRPADLTFSISVDERQFASLGAVQDASETEIRRRYTTRLVQQRVHQREFRERVLDAYHRTCAICRLKRPELLDAAHIIEDGDAAGAALVTNGLSLCKLHHSAFDANILGISPDYVIQIREDVLREVDGPMLIHGLQGWNQKHLSVLPGVHKRPDPDRLAVRYDRFLAATP